MPVFDVVLTFARWHVPGLAARRPTSFWRPWLLAALLTAAHTGPARAQEPEATLGEQVLMVPAGGLTEPELEVTVYRPSGPGPYPVVVINHGRAPGLAKLQPRYRPTLAAREFLRRGYAVVVPMRQGFSRSGGAEVNGGCNVHSNGLQQARSVRRTLDWLATQPWADVSRNVVMGQSHGGLTTLAYGTAPHPGTRLLVNFAGGLRQESCPAWEQNLVRAIGDYGQGTRLPSVWFYGDNDSFFSPTLWRSAYQRYTELGGRVDLVAYGLFGSDAHQMFGSRGGLAIWLEPVLQAMRHQNLPTAVVLALDETPDLPVPAATGYAALDDVERVPVQSERAREGYLNWRRAESPKAFAVHPTKGSWGSAWGGERPYARALANCERFAKAPCKLYAVDDAVVWRAD